MNKKKVSLMLALLLSIGSINTVSATPSLESQLESQKEELRSLESELSNVEGDYSDLINEISDLEIEVQEYDNQIVDLMLEIEEIELEVEAKEKEMDKLEEELDKLQEEINEQMQGYSSRLRGMYMSGSNSYIEVVLGSKDISDVVSSVNAVKSVMEYDSEIIGDLEDSMQGIDEIKLALEVEQEELDILSESIDKQLIEIEEAKDAQAVVLAELQDKRSEVEGELASLNSEIDRQEVAIAQTMSEIEGSQNSGSGSNDNSGSDNNSGSNNNGGSNNGTAQGWEIVNYAKTFLGTPYLYGGTSPSTGFDCSGFTMYVYKNFGYDITRTTYTQINVGQSVSKNNLQVGDLVFFGSASSPRHVGIYVGNGQYIHSPQTGDVVKISSLSSRSDFCAARRIIN